MRLLRLLPLFVLPALTAAAATPAERLQADLIRGTATAVGVEWTISRGAESRRLRIESDQAELARCAAPAAAPAAGSAPPAASGSAPACQRVAGPVALTAGQRDRLLSGLRSLGLSTLRGVAEGRAADRALVVRAGGARVGSYRLPRTEWPVPPDGEAAGLPAFLDETADRLEQQAGARRPVPIPQTVADLAAIRIKFQVRPRTGPGGLLLITGGVATITPEEGTVPRRPRPGPSQRPLTADEQANLLRELLAADLPHLADAVPRRDTPAIGDTDGRLCTLHLLPPEDPAAPLADAQPRGWERFAADLSRSPAAPLVAHLLDLLTAPPRQAQAGAARGHGR